MTDIVFGLIGAGGFGREVMPFAGKSVARTLGAAVRDITLVFVESLEPKQSHVNGYPLLSLNHFLALEAKKYFNVAIGDGKVREAMVGLVGKAAAPLPLVAEQALMLDANHLAEGAILCPNTMVTSNAQIGCFFQCNIYSYVAHDCVIGDYVTFAPGVRCNGRVHIHDYAYIGTNAVMREGSRDKPLRIGKGAVVGMGAVVTKDVPDGITVVGNPARPLVKR